MTTENIQQLCLALPATTEDVKWGHDLVFSVGSKMFCVVGLDQQPVSASFKVQEDVFDELCSREGFKPAPYMAKHKWVWVDDISRMKKKEWEQQINTSYELVKAKLTGKLKKELGLNA